MRFPILVAVMVALLGVLGYFVEKIYPLQLVSFEVSVTLVGVTFTCTFIVDILLRVSELQSKQKAFMEYMEKARVVDPILEKFRNFNVFIRDVGEKSLRDQVNSISIKGHGFGILGRDWAMRANKSFWVELQRIAVEQSRKKQKLTCYALHSSDPRLWKESESLESVIEQQRLTNLGGIVKRIIVGSPPIDEMIDRVRSTNYEPVDEFKRRIIRVQFLDGHPSTQDYADVIILMALHGIDVHYCPMDDASFVDFACVLIDGKEIAVTWHYSHRLGRVEECTFEESDGNFEERWNAISVRATPLTHLVHS